MRKPATPDKIFQEHGEEIVLKPDSKTNWAQTGYDADDLQRMDFPPIKYIVEGYIPEGLTIFAGRPKIGKSWANLDIAIAVATGNMAFGSIPCEQGDVLYLALEDNPRRLKSRMEKLHLRGDSWPKALRFDTQWPRLNAGGADKIREWIESKTTNPRLVIIDTLGKVRDAQSKQESAYQADYEALAALQTLASEKGLAIVIIHHDRKMDSEDPIDAVSGTLGLAGAADTILVLKRKPEGVTLYGRGRDIQEIETVMKFSHRSCTWSIVGNAAEVKKSDERGEITAILDKDMQPMKPQEIADILGKTSVAARRLMTRMARDGDIQKLSYGVYASKNYIARDEDSESTAETDHTSHSVTTEEKPKETSGLHDVGSVTSKKKVVTPSTRKRKTKKKTNKSRMAKAKIVQ